MTGNDPFAVDVDAAISALSLAWSDEYSEIGFSDGEWYACRQGDDDSIRASTPDELNRKIRDDWSARHHL